MKWFRKYGKRISLHYTLVIFLFYHCKRFCNIKCALSQFYAHDLFRWDVCLFWIQDTCTNPVSVFHSPQFWRRLCLIIKDPHNTTIRAQSFRFELFNFIIFLNTTVELWHISQTESFDSRQNFQISGRFCFPHETGLVRIANSLELMNL